MRGTVRRTAAMLLILGMLFSLAGCGEEKEAVSVVKSMFFSYYLLKPQEAQSYIDFDESGLSDTENKALDKSQVYIKYLLQRLKYNIVSAEATDDDTVIVKAEIKAVNLRPLITEILGNVSQYRYLEKLSRADQMTDEDREKIEEIFRDIASRTELITITSEVDIKVVRSDDKWIIVADRALINALYGGFLDIIKEKGLS